MDDECLLINTSIPGYHISLAYLPALNYSCDMDIRPISIYFMDHNSQNWTRYFISVLMLKHFKSHKPKQWLLDQNETEKFFSIWFSVQAHICNFITNDHKYKIYPKYICRFLLLLLVRSLNLWFMQTFVSIDILRCIFLSACLGYARFYTPPKSHVWPFTKFIEFSQGAITSSLENTNPTKAFEWRQDMEVQAGFKARRFETKAIDSKQWRHASFGTTGDNWAIETQRFKTTIETEWT